MKAALLAVLGVGCLCCVNCGGGGGSDTGGSAGGTGGDTTPPGMPVSLTAASTYRSVTLAWAVTNPYPNTPPATSYNLLRSTKPGREGAVPIATGISGTNYVDQTANTQQPYFYEVEAVSDAGAVSTPSDETSAWPGSRQYTLKVISPAGSGQMLTTNGQGRFTGIIPVPPSMPTMDEYGLITYGLIADGQGGYLGMTGGSGHGPYGPGTQATLFDYKVGGGITTLASFNNPNSSIATELCVLANGDIYGTTSSGGNGDNYNGPGTIFKYSAGAGFSILHTFPGWVTGVFGPQPSPLSIDSQGNFWGVMNTSLNGDTLAIFKYNPSTGFSNQASVALVEKTPDKRLDPSTELTYFCPCGGLVADGSGNYYGLNQTGDIYRYTPGGSLTTVATFNGLNGLEPMGSLVTDGKGDFFGTTTGGGIGWAPPTRSSAGAPSSGTVFMYNAKTGISVLASIPDGETTFGLATDGKGNFYGMTLSGMIYEVSPA